MDLYTWLRHREGTKTSWRAARLVEEKARRSGKFSSEAMTHCSTL